MLEMPDGQVTPGIFDLRPYVARYGIPGRLDGMRALEVVVTVIATWAFERPLLREVLGYLRGTRAAAPAPA